MPENESLTEPSPFPTYQSPPASLSPTPAPSQAHAPASSSSSELTPKPSTPTPEAKPSSPPDVADDSNPTARENAEAEPSGILASVKATIGSGLIAIGLGGSAEEAKSAEGGGKVKFEKPKSKGGKEKRRKKRGPRVTRADDLLEDSDQGEDAAAGSESESDGSSLGSDSEDEDGSEGSDKEDEEGGLGTNAQVPSAITAPTPKTPSPGKQVEKVKVEGGKDWSEMMEEEEGVVVMQFDEFNRKGLPIQPTASTSSAPAGKQPTNLKNPTKKFQAGKTAATPEELAKRLDEKRAKQKEKRKEKAAKKREELKAAATPAALKKQEKDAPLEDWGTGGPAAGISGKKDKAEGEANGDAAKEAGPSEPAPPALPSPQTSRFNNREAYQTRLNNDPKIVPRVGTFWTHDERHYQAGKVGQGDSEFSGLREMSDFWRGRGGRGRGGRGAFAPRGAGFRGGRGGFAVPGGPTPGQHARQVPPHQPLSATVATTAPSEGPESAETVGAEPIEGEAETGAVTVNMPPPTAPKKKWGQGGNPDSDRNWTHDGFVEMAAEEERRSAAFRGRGGRGGAFRGAMNGPRGGGMHHGQVKPWLGGQGRGAVPPHIQGKLAMDTVPVPPTTEPALPVTPLAATSTPVEEDPKVKKNWQADLVKQQQHAAAAEKVVVKLPRSVSSTGAPSDDAVSRRASVAQHPSIEKEIPVETVILPPPTNSHQSSTSAPPDPPQPSAVSADLPKPIPVTAANLQQHQGGESDAVSSLQLQAEYAALRQQQDIMRQRELKLQEEMRLLELQRFQQGPMTASENGSVGSGGGPPPSNLNGLPPSAIRVDGGYYDPVTGQSFHFVHTPPPVATGGYSPIPVPPSNGVPNASRIPSNLSAGLPAQQAYYPQPGLQQQQQQQQAYYSQQGGMGDYMQQQMRSQHQQRTGSGSFNPFTPTYPTQNIPLSSGGRESPYSSSPSSIPHFMPPRQSSKIQIRAPSSEDIANLITKPRKTSNAAYPSEHPQQQIEYQGGQNMYAYQSNGQGQRQDPRQQYFAVQGQQQYPQQQPQFGQQEGYEYGYNPQYGGAY